MTALLGKTVGLKGSELEALRRLGRRRVDPRDVVSWELAREIAQLSATLSRRIGVLLDRRGRVRYVCIGDAHRLPLPPLRTAEKHLRLRGLRLIHTRFAATLSCGGGEFPRADLVDLLRLRLDLSLRLAVSEQGRVEHLTAASLMPPGGEGGVVFQVREIRNVSQLRGSFGQEIAALEEELGRLGIRPHEVGQKERAILAGVWNGDRGAAERSMAELAALAASSGAEVVDSVLQRRERPDPRTLIGRGKLWELNVLALHRNADVVLFNHELTPAMARNLDQELPVKVIDRTQLILDIFAQRASSSEGKLEVELARLLHALPRLRADDERMPQIRGGIGSDRGVGEPKIELDRRKIKRRISLLEKRLAQIALQRRELRKHRQRNQIPVVALVGYTNAGKTTLLNRLVAAGAPAGPQLFMTLESVSRRFTLPSGRKIIVVDTVGFIRELPPGLMRAFRATLEELQGADVLVHVADASDPDVFSHIEVVEEVLGEIGLGDRPRVLLFNKVDQIIVEDFKPLLQGRPAAFVSALRPAVGAFLGEVIERALDGTALPADPAP